VPEEPERLEGEEFLVEIDRKKGIARVVDKVEGREYVLSPFDVYEWFSELGKKEPKTHEEKVRLLEKHLKRAERRPPEEKLEIEVRAKPPPEERAEVEISAKPPKPERVEEKPEELPPPRPARAEMRRIKEGAAGEWRLEVYGRGETPEFFVLKHPGFGEYELTPEELEEVKERVRVESMRRALGPEDVAEIVEEVLKERRARPAPPPPAPPERVERAAEELRERLAEIEEARRAEEERKGFEVEFEAPAPEKFELEVKARRPKEEKHEIVVGGGGAPPPSPPPPPPEAPPEGGEEGLPFGLVGAPKPRALKPPSETSKVYMRIGEWRVESYYAEPGTPSRVVLSHPRYGKFELKPEEVPAAAQALRTAAGLARRGMLEPGMEVALLREALERARREKPILPVKASGADVESMESALRAIEVRRGTVPLYAGRPATLYAYEWRDPEIPRVRFEAYEAPEQPERLGMLYGWWESPTGERFVDIVDPRTRERVTVTPAVLERAVKRKAEELKRMGLPPDLARAHPDVLRYAKEELLAEAIKEEEKARREREAAARGRARRLASGLGAARRTAASLAGAGFGALVEARLPAPAAMSALLRLTVYGGIAAGAGLVGGWIERYLLETAKGLMGAAPELGAALALVAWILSWLYSGVYLVALMALHVLIAGALLVATRMVRSQLETWEYRRRRKGAPRMVDLIAWTAISAVMAATARAVWVPVVFAYVAGALYAGLVAMLPLLAFAATLLVLALLAVVAIAVALSQAGWSGLGNALLAVLGGPLLPVAGFLAQLHSMAQLAEAAWVASDVALAVLLALVGALARIAEPLAAAAMAAVWVVFGLVASGSRDWRWFRVPLAATAAYVVVKAGWGGDWAARAAIDLFRAAGEQLGSMGMVRVAGFYEWLLEALGVKL
jgi:hypothetical protein